MTYTYEKSCSRCGGTGASVRPMRSTESFGIYITLCGDAPVAEHEYLEDAIEATDFLAAGGAWSHETCYAPPGRPDALRMVARRPARWSVERWRLIDRGQYVVDAVEAEWSSGKRVR
ncbi:hypothetical protein EBS80_04245 [bacterium]|nr:hypothetical protein [bacterium]